jgi:hypothetical protein
LIKESVVEKDLQLAQLQYYLDKIAHFALKKMILAANEHPSQVNNFKENGGLLKRLKGEFTYALVELGRDPNL